MANYKVSLADLGSGLSTGDKNQLAGDFRSWLSQVNQQAHPRYATVGVDWVSNANAASRSSLIIYFVANSTLSVIASAPTYNGGVRNDFGGMTLLPPGSRGLSASEVYVTEHNGDLAQVFITMVHEAMHNQRRQGDAMHSLGGAAASPGTAPTPENRSQMAERFNRHRDQWNGGFQAFASLNNSLGGNSNSPPP